MVRHFSILGFFKYSGDVVGMWIEPLALAIDMTRGLHFWPFWQRASMSGLDFVVFFIDKIFRKLIMAKDK